MTAVPLKRLLRPVERFLATENASGVILIVAAPVAFAWANSPWAGLYAHLQHVEAGSRSAAPASASRSPTRSTTA